MVHQPASRLRAWRPGRWEVLLAVVVVAASVGLLADADPATGFRQPDALSWVLTLAGTAVVVYFRRQPLFALVVAGVAFVVLTWRGDESDLAPLLATGLLFSVGNLKSRRPAVFGLVIACLALLASAAALPPDLGAVSVVQSLVIFAAAWVIGRLNRIRRQALLALIAAAEQQAATERELATSERDQATLAQAEERLRIARELHDVLAHSISVISVQATVGEHLIATDPTAGRRGWRSCSWPALCSPTARDTHRSGPCWRSRSARWAS